MVTVPPKSCCLVDIGHEAWTLWTDVGFSQELNSSAEIAIFLLQHYKRWQDDVDQQGRCHSCSQPLVLMCPQCNNRPSESRLSPMQLSKSDCETTPTEGVGLCSTETVCKTASMTFKPSTPKYVSLSKMRKKEEGDSNLNAPSLTEQPEQARLKKKGLQHVGVCKTRKAGALSESSPETDTQKMAAERAKMEEGGSEKMEGADREKVADTKREKMADPEPEEKEEDEREQIGGDCKTVREAELQFIANKKRKANSRKGKKLAKTSCKNTTTKAEHVQLATPSSSISEVLIDDSSTNDVAEAGDIDNNNDIPDDENEIMARAGERCSLDPEDAFSMNKNLPHNNKNCSDARKFSMRAPEQQKQTKGDKRNRYQCTICHIRYSRSDSLKVHMRRHSGDRPFICETCGSSFSRSYCLAAHKMTHSGDKPFRCCECNATFAQSGKLTIHMRKHSGDRPFLCNLCGVSFAQSDRLKTHMRSHSGVKPYKCSDCGKGFSHPHSLKVHSRSHTGQRPYRCDLCSLTFADPSYFRRHKAKHTAAALGSAAAGSSATPAEWRKNALLQSSNTEGDNPGEDFSGSSSADISALKDTIAALSQKDVDYENILNNRLFTESTADSSRTKRDFGYPGALNRSALPDKKCAYQNHQNISRSAIVQKDTSAKVVVSQSVPSSSVAEITAGYSAQIPAVAELSDSSASAILPDAYDILNSSAFHIDSFSAASSMFGVSVSSAHASTLSDVMLTVPSISRVRFQQPPVSTTESLNLPALSGMGLTVPSVSRLGLHHVPISSSFSVPENSASSVEDANAAMAAESFAFLNSAFQGNFAT